MTRSALILAAHGSNHEPAVNEQIREYARQVSGKVHFDEYGVAFHQGDPHFSKVLDEITADDVTIVPVMVSDGYYYSTVLPRELAKNGRFSEVVLRITPPVGTHEAIESLVRRRALALTEQFSLSTAKAALVVVGHGTPKNKQSRASTIEVVDTIARERLFAEVIPAFLDEEPFIESILQRAASKAVLVVPFLIAAGAHASQDIPRRMEIELPHGGQRPATIQLGLRTIVIDRSIGTDPGIIDIIVDLAKQESDVNAKPNHAANAIGRSLKSLRLGTRGSKLALWQANHVAARLRGEGIEVELIEIATLGDRRMDLPIAELPSEGPFTDDIEESLRRGEIDFAVHALKDLPVLGAEDLVIAAVLKRGNASEALVSREHLTLAELSAGSVIGTSSPRRAAQLLAMRPDLRTTPIRGAVDARVRDVRAGAFDAVILATAGLERLGLLDEFAEQFPINEFLPAPGQAALVVQTRRGDDEIVRLMSRLEHRPTRLATDAELALLRYFDHRKDVALAAFATMEGDEIRMYARLLTSDGGWSHECHVVGTDVRVVADAAEKQLSHAFLRRFGATV